MNGFFSDYDWTAVTVLEARRTQTTAGARCSAFGDTQIYQLGFKRNGRTDVVYDGAPLCFCGGTVLYLPRESRPDVPYHRTMAAAGRGAYVFFRAAQPLPPKPALFSLPNPVGAAQRFEHLVQSVARGDALAHCILPHFGTPAGRPARRQPDGRDAGAAGTGCAGHSRYGAPGIHRLGRAGRARRDDAGLFPALFPGRVRGFTAAAVLAGKIGTGAGTAPPGPIGRGDGCRRRDARPQILRPVFPQPDGRAAVGVCAGAEKLKGCRRLWMRDNRRTPANKFK